MKLINLTPHEIVIDATAHRPYGHPDGEDWVASQIRIAPSGVVARVQSEREWLEDVYVITGDDWNEFVPVMKETLGEIDNLPAPDDKTIYVVSAVVLSAVKAKYPERTDVFAPDTLNATRNDKGHIVSVPALVR